MENAKWVKPDSCEACQVKKICKIVEENEKTRHEMCPLQEAEKPEPSVDCSWL